MQYLPIGSVVKYKKMKDKTVMIYGRQQHSSFYDKNFDYVAVLYPEGNINDQFNYFFNHEDIVEVIYKGYVDEMEIAFQEKILNREKNLKMIHHEEGTTEDV